MNPDPGYFFRDWIRIPFISTKVGSRYGFFGLPIGFGSTTLINTNPCQFSIQHCMSKKSWHYSNLLYRMCQDLSDTQYINCLKQYNTEHSMNYHLMQSNSWLHDCYCVSFRRDTISRKLIPFLWEKNKIKGKFYLSYNTFNTGHAVFTLDHR